MPFLLDDDHRQIVQEAERIMADGWSPDRLRDLLEQTGAHDDAFWATCSEMGWTGITIDEAHDGLALGPIALCLTAQVVGRFAGGAPFLSTGYGVSEVLRLNAPAPLADEWLPKLADGSAIGAICLNTALSQDRPVLSLRDGALHGTGGPVAAGLQAHLLVAIAYDEASSEDVLVLAALDERTTRTPVPTFDNSRGYADLRFDGAPVTVLSGGRQAALNLLGRVAVVTAFEQLGAAEACLERARAFANEREAFGQPIGKFQAVKHRIAEMYVGNELARGNALRAALSLRDDADDLVLRAGAARLSASEASEFAAREAIQIHGAIGVTWEHDLHLFYRRARALGLELGSVAAWQDVVADRVVAAQAGKAAA